MRILYLIPPSEWKNSWWDLYWETLSFVFSKPKKIALHATEKDLKCTGKRYEEAREMNKQLLWNKSPYSPPQWGGSELDSEQGEFLSAVSRYSGVMYSAIDYLGMNTKGKEFFDTRFLILSGMYGLLRPQDTIGNYKLPIETKWLVDFWKKKITKTLNELDVDIIVDLLPWSYKKMIDWEKIQARVVQVDFFEEKNGEKKKLTHSVKKVKGEWIKKICETPFTDFWDFLKDGQKHSHIEIIS